MYAATCESCSTRYRPPRKGGAHATGPRLPSRGPNWGPAAHSPWPWEATGRSAQAGRRTARGRRKSSRSGGSSACRGGGGPERRRLPALRGLEVRGLDQLQLEPASALLFSAPSFFAAGVGRVAAPLRAGVREVVLLVAGTLRVRLPVRQRAVPAQIGGPLRRVNGQRVARAGLVHPLEPLHRPRTLR